jgi:hypothetical protein
VPISPTSNSATPPQGGLSSCVGKLKNGLRNNSVAAAIASHRAEVAQSAVAINLWPMLPLLLAGGAMIYNQGHQSKDFRGGDANAWKRVSTEAVIGHWLVENTIGVYPLMGIALSAFRAGKAPTLPEKLHAISSTAITLGMGWLGVQTFSNFSKSAREIDDQKILNGLNQDALKSQIRSLVHHSDPQQQALGKTLQQLQEKLTRKSKLPKNNWEARKQLRQDASHLKADIVSLSEQQAERLQKTLKTPGHAHFQKLLQRIEASDSGFTKFLRYTNPLCGYIIMGLLLGAPAARWVNGKLDAYLATRYPKFTERKFNQSSPSSENAILQTNILSRGSNSASPGLPGPTINWPDDPPSS